MTKSEAVEHLKNSTLKIDNASRTGTGFFIADKLIATCYHNIKGHAKDELSVSWQGEAYSVKNIEISQEDDLALLEIKIDKKHPILQIDESVEVGDDCQSFGYSTKNGDVITFKYEGKDGDGRLKFKEGLFQSGLSGGAILNFRTHKICGIVKSKRDNTESVALGGRAIPISKLSNFERLDMDNNGSIFSKEMFKKWVWTSSLESADRLQFSVLALVETLVAVGLSFFIWIYYEFYWHIVTGLVVAPLFLLETEKSKNYILNNYLQIKEKIIQYTVFLLFPLLMFFGWIGLFLFWKTFPTDILMFQHLGGMFSFALGMAYGFMFLIIIFIFLLKFVSMLKYISLPVLPTNWFRFMLCMDIFHYPEVMSGIEKRKYSDLISYQGGKNLNNLRYYQFSTYLKFFHSILQDKRSMFDKFMELLLTVGILIFFIPTMIFRYSLKSTAWIYLPLIWLIQPQDKQNLTTRLKIESKNFIAYLMFFYSLVVVFVFTLLPLIFPHTQLGIYFQTLAIPPTLKTIFFAYEFNLWHLTRFLSAVITIVFMFSFTKILIMREVNPSYGDFWGTKLLSLRTVRSVLTLVTLGFTAYHIFGLVPDDFFVNLWENMKFVPHI